MVDLTPIVIALERSGGWVGQPLDRLLFALHLRASGRMLWPPWRLHIAGSWYGGKWWSLAVASQN